MADLRGFDPQTERRARGAANLVARRPRRIGARTRSTEEDAMATVTKGLWVPLEAKPGKEADMARFLEGGHSLVEG
jgi:hypothetical protein